MVNFNFGLGGSKSDDDQTTATTTQDGNAAANPAVSAPVDEAQPTITLDPSTPDLTAPTNPAPVAEVTPEQPAGTAMPMMFGDDSTPAADPVQPADQAVLAEPVIEPAPVAEAPAEGSFMPSFGDPAPAAEVPATENVADVAAPVMDTPVEAAAPATEPMALADPAPLVEPAPVA